MAEKAKGDWPRPMSREERRRFNEGRGIKPRPKRKEECKHCRQVFHPKQKDQRFCSRECYRAFAFEGTPKGRTAAQERADGRVKKATIRCRWCGDVFHPNRSTQRFCKVDCRVEFNKADQKDQARRARADEIRAEILAEREAEQGLKPWMRKGDPAAILAMLGEFCDGEGLCAYDIGTRLGYRFGLRTVDARRVLEKLENAGVVKSWRAPERNIWLRVWQLTERGEGNDGDR